MNSSDNSTDPFLQDGRGYTIFLKNNRIVKDVVYNHCALSGNHYFSKGDAVYPIENVQSHSMGSHEISDGASDSDLTISEDDGDTLEVWLSQEKTPIIYQRKVKCLMRSGMTEAEAKHHITQVPMVLELFYDVGRGLFAVESETVDSTSIYNPYTGEEIPSETE